MFHYLQGANHSGLNFRRIFNFNSFKFSLSDSPLDLLAHHIVIDSRTDCRYLLLSHQNRNFNFSLLLSPNTIFILVHFSLCGLGVSLSTIYCPHFLPLPLTLSIHITTLDHFSLNTGGKKVIWVWVLKNIKTAIKVIFVSLIFSHSQSLFTHTHIRLLFLWILTDALNPRGEFCLLWAHVI